MSAMSILQRMKSGLRGQVAAKLAQVFIQLLDIPIMLHFWGPQLMGEWMVITAVPAYFAFSDLGFANVAVREMTVLVGAGKRDEARDVFRTGTVLLAGLAVVIAVLMIPLSFAPLSDLFNLEIVTSREAFLILLMFALAVACWFQITLISGGFAAEGRYGRGFSVMAGVQVANQAAFWATLALGGGPVAGAMAMVAGRLAGAAVYGRMALSSAPWLTYGRRGARMDILRRLLAPSIASFIHALNRSLNVQGARILVSIALGPAMVAVFATMRTLTGLIFQVATGLHLIISPEIARAHGQNAIEALRSIHRRACQITLWYAVTAALGLFAASGWLIPVWTGGKIPVDPWLLGALLVLAVCNVFWETSFRVELATNRHVRLVKLQLPISLAMTLLGFWLMRTTQSIHPFIAALAMIDVAMIALVLRVSLELTHDKLPGFLRTALTPPVFLLKHLSRAKPVEPPRNATQVESR